MTKVTWKVGNVEFNTLEEAHKAAAETGYGIEQIYTEYGFYDEEDE